MMNRIIVVSQRLKTERWGELKWTLKVPENPCSDRVGPVGPDRAFSTVHR